MFEIKNKIFIDLCFSLTNTFPKFLKGIVSYLFYFLSMNMYFSYPDERMKKILYTSKCRIEEAMRTYNPSEKELSTACLNYMKLKGMYYACLPIYVRLSRGQSPGYEYLKIMEKDIDNCKKELMNDTNLLFPPELKNRQ